MNGNDTPITSYLMVAVVRDPGSGQSEARLSNLPEEDASPLFKGKNAKVGFIEGAKDPALFTVSYEYTNADGECVDRMRTVRGDYLATFTIFEESLTHLTLVKEVPDDTDADTVEVCDKLGPNL
ncbi:hypothetical protein KKD52_00345 [Myxococcota bacterium]|nr:hypothetical protein [Myxococcota bacterium]MBU1412653.1 hypothetical protein [Myxococcota bacterium]MBU1508780.1 hypothetical protein [Myxococcota bacterium]